MQAGLYSTNSPFDAIVDRLNGTLAKVSKLRLALGELEAELSDIHRQCENTIHACAPVASADKAHDNDEGAPITHCHRAHRGPVSLKASESNSDQSTTGTSRGDPKEQRRERIPRSESRRDPKSSRSSSQSRTVVAEAEVQGLVPSRRHAESPSIAEQSRVTHPPTNPFPFPKDIDLSSYPTELKCEGDDWFVLFNRSPKVKRVLEVNLEHDLVHESWATCVRFSRDGKWVATGSLTAQIYDVKTGVETYVFDDTQSVYIWIVCFSPDGRYLATVSIDMRVRIWNIVEKDIHSTFKGRQGWVDFLDFTPDGQFIISSSHGSVRIWDIHGVALKALTMEDHYLPDQHRRVQAVAISPNGKYVAVGSQLDVIIREVSSDMLVQTLRGHEYGVSSVAFTPDGKGLISGGWDCTLKYWDISGLNIGSGASTALAGTSSSRCLMNLTGHNDSIRSTAVSHDSTWVVSGSDDGKVLFWDVRTGMAQYMLSGHEGVVRQVDLDATGNFLATAGLDGRVKIWRYGIFGSGV